MTAFVVIGQSARADDQVRFDDLPGTSGRLDVLARCLRAALCISHGVREDVVVYLVLEGGTEPVTVRCSGARAKFIRPDERSLAMLIAKSVARHTGEREFVEQRHGVAVAAAGIDAVLADVSGKTSYVLEEGAADIRGSIGIEDSVFFVGDHLGFNAETRARLVATGARPVSVGPLSLHSDDVVALVSNEVDRVTSTA